MVLLFLQQAAWADLWAYVDERGVTHFAAEPVDGRYALFFRGQSFDSARDGAAGAQATPGNARLLASFDIAPGFKSVRHHLRAAAERYGVEFELLQALIATESGFDAAAVSPRGAIGLMQLMPATAARFGVAAQAGRTAAQRLADPATNVAAGTRYLRHLLDLFEGRMELALAAYNAGEGAVLRAGQQIPPIPETRNYVRSVLGLYQQLKPQTELMARRAAAGRVRMELQGASAPATVSPPGEPAGLPARVALGASTELQSNE